MTHEGIGLQFYLGQDFVMQGIKLGLVAIRKLQYETVAKLIFKGIHQNGIAVVDQKVIQPKMLADAKLEELLVYPAATPEPGVLENFPVIGRSFRKNLQFIDKMAGMVLAGLHDPSVRWSHHVDGVDGMKKISTKTVDAPCKNRQILWGQRDDYVQWKITGVVLVCREIKPTNLETLPEKGQQQGSLKMQSVILSGYH